MSRRSRTFQKSSSGYYRFTIIALSLAVTVGFGLQGKSAADGSIREERTGNDTYVSPEFEVDEPILGPAFDHQGTSSIVFGEDGYLVVWNDWRNYSITGFDIYGCRMSPDGRPLDIAGIAISTAPDLQEMLAVSFDGTNYLVVWKDRRNEIRTQSDVYGARVSPDGTVLDPEGLPIFTGDQYQENPAVAFGGTNYLVVWVNSITSDITNDIHGTLVSPDGVVLNPDGIVISAADASQKNPVLSSNGTDFLVLWQDERNESTTGADIYGARVQQGGDVLDPEGIPICTSPGNQGALDITFGGIHYVVSWSDSGDLYSVRMDAEGSILDQPDVPLFTSPGNQGNPSMSFDGSNFLLAWTDSRNPYDFRPDIYGSRMNPERIVLDPDGILISAAANRQENPAVSFDGTNSLVVWEDYRDLEGKKDIFGARIGFEENVLDPQGILISSTENPQTNPAVAFDGTNYLVLWEEEFEPWNKILGTRVSMEGTVLDPEGLVIDRSLYDLAGAPAVAYDGENYMVIWEDGIDIPYEMFPDIRGVRINEEGLAVDEESLTICEADWEQFNPSIDFNGSDYLAVWEDYRFGYDHPSIYGARVNTEGTVLDVEGIPISIGEDHRKCPAVACDGTNCLIVWEDGRNDSIDIYGARVSPEGAVLDGDGIRVSDSSKDEANPSVLFDGTNYLVAWQDRRACPDYPPSMNSDIYGARITPDGLLLDPGGFALSDYPGEERDPVLASCVDLRCLILYARFDESNQYGDYRIRGRFVDTEYQEDEDDDTDADDDADIDETDDDDDDGCGC